MSRQGKSGASPQRGEWLIKYLARAGVGSRREVARLIEQGRISLGGRTIRNPALRVARGDPIKVDGKSIGSPAPTRLWRHYKPRGLITTHHDPQGRPTVFSALPRRLGRVISVGRLDFNSEGLLLLTNDGELARWLEMPSSGMQRTYRVRVFGTIDSEQLSELSTGIEFDGVSYGPITAQVESTKGANSWLRMTLQEGKNREIRRVMQYLGLEVSRLIRTSYGPYELGELNRGQVRKAKPSLIPNLPDKFLDRPKRNRGAPGRNSRRGPGRKKQAQE